MAGSLHQLVADIVEDWPGGRFGGGVLDGHHRLAQLDIFGHHLARGQELQQGDRVCLILRLLRNAETRSDAGQHVGLVPGPACDSGEGEIAKLEAFGRVRRCAYLPRAVQHHCSLTVEEEHIGFLIAHAVESDREILLLREFGELLHRLRRLGAQRRIRIPVHESRDDARALEPHFEILEPERCRPGILVAERKGDKPFTFHLLGEGEQLFIGLRHRPAVLGETGLVVPEHHRIHVYGDGIGVTVLAGLGDCAFKETVTPPVPGEFLVQGIHLPAFDEGVQEAARQRVEDIRRIARGHGGVELRLVGRLLGSDHFELDLGMGLCEFAESEVDEFDLVLLTRISVPERKLSGGSRHCCQSGSGAGDQKTFQPHDVLPISLRPSTAAHEVMPHRKSRVYSDTTTSPC